jgi:hypothetical protein
MKLTGSWLRRVKALVLFVVAGSAFFSLPGAAQTQGQHDPRIGEPEAEFQIARIIYATNRRAGSHGWIQPMWAVDYPLADAHFLETLRRYTKIQVADDSRHLELTDERLFKFPFLWLQQPAAGQWNPSKDDAAALHEYLMRGGFMMVDDFHGDNEWDYFASVMNWILPDFQIVTIPPEDPVMHTFFDIDQTTKIPGDRHLRRGANGETVVTSGTPHFRGIYDSTGRLMVIANHNMDIGDSWEHADTPEYPLALTAAGYQLGVNYVLYAMTH